MKKTVYLLFIALFAFGAIVTSCDDDEILNDEPTGTYKLTINGSLFEGTTLEVGMYENNISLSEGEDFSILIANVPETVGSTVVLGGEDENVGLLTITGKNILLDNGSDELYFSISGTIKRESATKISFNGTCSQFMVTTSHTFSGTVESDVFKII